MGHWVNGIEGREVGKKKTNPHQTHTTNKTTTQQHQLTIKPTQENKTTIKTTQTTQLNQLSKPNQPLMRVEKKIEV